MSLDTRKFVRKLNDAGVPENQAEAQRATKPDIDDIRRALRDMA